MGVSDYADIQPDWTFVTMREFVDEMERQRK
jgi:hypothetical protein